MAPRVSVARSKGKTFIDAEVIEVQSSVPVTPDLKLEDLDVLGAYRSFLEQPARCAAPYAECEPDDAATNEAARSYSRTQVSVERDLPKS